MKQKVPASYEAGTFLHNFKLSGKNRRDDKNQTSFLSEASILSIPMVRASSELEYEILRLSGASNAAPGTTAM